MGVCGGKKEEALSTAKGATRGAKGAEAPLSQVKVEKKDKKF